MGGETALGVAARSAVARHGPRSVLTRLAAAEKAPLPRQADPASGARRRSARHGRAGIAGRVALAGRISLCDAADVCGPVRAPEAGPGSVPVPGSTLQRGAARV